MATERFIENNVIRNRERLGLADAPFIRRCRAGRGYGIVDLLFLPTSGPHDVVLVEAKRASSPDQTASRTSRSSRAAQTQSSLLTGPRADESHTAGASAGWTGPRRNASLRNRYCPFSEQLPQRLLDGK
jgi:hypothetical protein